MKDNRKKILEKCEQKLIDLKYKYQLTLSMPMNNQNQGGEIIDMASREQMVQDSTYFRNRIQSVLPEIYYALEKIKSGTYGYCEVTGETIETNRLLAVPWTRVSIKALDQEAS